MQAVSSVVKKRDFKTLANSKEYRGSRFFLLKIAKVESAVPLIGFVVTRKIGSAVVRNKIKRRLRSILKCGKCNSLLGPNRAYLIIVKKSIVDAEFAHIERAMFKSLQERKVED